MDFRRFPHDTQVNFLKLGQSLTLSLTTTRLARCRSTPMAPRSGTTHSGCPVRPAMPCPTCTYLIKLVLLFHTLSPFLPSWSTEETAKQVIFYISNFLNKIACTNNTVPTTTTTTNTMQVNPKIDLPQFKVDTTFNDNWSVLTLSFASIYHKSCVLDH